eukprot:TRINITY_DN12709_c0_g2_i1.p1 TRINITY_DN12709_c0_g2~~TRINITY_DN12709_c0_g2_i1.p1  ORF type:complete len:290 (-),score=12.66 TRINITY_DN12709_c0_g2_i1:122-991(-)
MRTPAVLVASYVALTTGVTADAVSPGVPAHIYYINLESSRDRARHMVDALSNFPGRVERFPAIGLQDLEQHSHRIQRQGLDESLKRMGAHTPAALKTVGCWLSHVVLWEMLQRQLTEDEAALILEDDVQFPPRWYEKLAGIVSAAPENWTVLKVCGWGHDRPSDAIDDQWSRARWPVHEDGEWKYTGTCGYIVRRSHLHRLLSHVRNQPIKDIDVAMMMPERWNMHLDTDYSIFEQRPHRRLLQTGGFVSTIRGPDDTHDYGHVVKLAATPIRATSITSVVTAEVPVEL